MAKFKVDIIQISHITFRILLFLSSYVPLFIILLLKNITNYRLSIINFFMSIVPIFIIRAYLNKPLKREPNVSLVIKEVSHKGSEVLNYIVAYIVPFIPFNSDVIKEKGVDIPNLVSIVILFIVIGNLYMSSNLYYINPILTLFFDVNSIKDNKDNDSIIISKKNLKIPKNEVVLVRQVSPKIYLYTDDRKNPFTILRISLLTIFLLVIFWIWNTEMQSQIGILLNYVKGS